MDLLDLIKDRMKARGASGADLSRACTGKPGGLVPTLQGSSVVSSKSFSVIIKVLGVDKEPELLRKWLLAYLEEKLPRGLGETWMKRAGLM